MKKLKAISIICAMLMILGCLGAFPASAAGPSWATEGGDGTAENPYILNSNNFSRFALSTSINPVGMDQHLKLTSDIDLNPGWTAGETAPTNEVWTNPIGGSNAFYGVFDGNGYTISGIYLKTTIKGGLFSQVASQGTVKNLRVVNSYFECNPAANYTETGAIAGRISGTLENIYVDAIVCVRDGTATSGCVAGGIAGMVNSETAVIKNCTFAGSVTGSVTFSGGIVAKVNASKSLLMENCLNMAKEITGSHANVGGLIGRPDGNTTIKNCVSICYDINETETVPAEIIGGKYEEYQDKVTMENVILVEGLRTSDNAVADKGVHIDACEKWDINQVTMAAFLSENITKEGGALAGWCYRKNCIPTPSDIVPPTEIVDYVVKTLGIENLLALTMTGATVREGDNGIRFTASLNGGLLKSLLDLGISVKGMGTYITLAENVTTAESFTPEALTAAGKTYKDVSSDAGFYELPKTNESRATIAGSVTGISDESLSIAARAYVKVSIGGQDYTYLADWSADTGVASIADLS